MFKNTFNRRSKDSEHPSILDYSLTTSFSYVNDFFLTSKYSIYPFIFSYPVLESAFFNQSILCKSRQIEI